MISIISYIKNAWSFVFSLTTVPFLSLITAISGQPFSIFSSGTFAGRQPRIYHSIDPQQFQMILLEYSSELNLLKLL